jgi:hypothetical protein
MKKIIKLTEQDLFKIVKLVLKEQGSADFADIRRGEEQLSKVPEIPKVPTTASCLPTSMSPFVNYVKTNKKKLMTNLSVDEKTLLLYTKCAIGIMGRETQFGNVTEWSDDVSEFLRKWGMSVIPDTYLKVIDKTQSLGTAQFTPETWKKYGLDKKIGDYNSTLDSVSQGIGTLYRINQDYKTILKLGIGTNPSSNPILQKYGIIKEIKGTGNCALDFTILAHNMGLGKMTPYCTTNHPLYAAPCNQTRYSPYDDINSFNKNKLTSSLINSPKVPTNLKNFPGELIVNKGQVIPNYLPNLRGATHSGIGYVEQVAKTINQLTCVTI